ncbi:MAG: ABC transporter substrate-binding protein [Hylemonella sp.]|nr:ABC transporter substrate-binding protein [Hylemonella sp.]
MMRRRDSLLGLALPLALAWPARAAAPTDVVVSVPGPASQLSTPLELAVKLGLDRAEGIAIRFKFVEGGGVALRDLQTGNADFTVIGMPAAMYQHLSDPRIVVLAAHDDLPLYVVMVRNELRGKVRRIEDLRGRTIGIFSNSLTTKVTSQQFLELVLQRRGVKLDEIRLKSIGADWELRLSAMQTGLVDACMVDAVAAVRLAEAKVAYPVFNTSVPQDIKNMPGAAFLRGALIGRRDRVEADPGKTQQMVRTLAKVLGWMGAHTPEQVADALNLRGEERAAFVAVSRKYPRQYSRDGKFSAMQLRETEAFFRASNPDIAAAQQFGADAMVMDRWAGRKP